LDSRRRLRCARPHGRHRSARGTRAIRVSTHAVMVSSSTRVKEFPPRLFSGGVNGQELGHGPREGLRQRFRMTILRVGADWIEPALVSPAERGQASACPSVGDSGLETEASIEQGRPHERQLRNEGLGTHTSCPAQRASIPVAPTNSAHGRRRAPGGRARPDERMVRL
jgi:hypothetical protein